MSTSSVLGRRRKGQGETNIFGLFVNRCCHHCPEAIFYSNAAISLSRNDQRWPNCVNSDRFECAAKSPTGTGARILSRWRSLVPFGAHGDGFRDGILFGPVLPTRALGFRRNRGNGWRSTDRWPSSLYLRRVGRGVCRRRRRVGDHTADLKTLEQFRCRHR